MSTTEQKTAPVTDEELAEVEQAFTGPSGIPWLGAPIVLRLVAAERARREEDAALRRLLDEAGIVPREGDTVRTLVERLIGDLKDALSENGDPLPLKERICELIDDRNALRVDVERAARERDAATTRAEAAEADLARLRAPVDVAGECLRLLDALMTGGPKERAVYDCHGGRVLDVLRPLVAERARLARECAELRARANTAETDRDCARADLARVGDAFDEARAELRAARAEIERLTRERDALRAVRNKAAAIVRANNDGRDPFPEILAFASELTK